MSVKRGKKMASPWWGDKSGVAAPQGTLDPSLLPKLGQSKRGPGAQGVGQGAGQGAGVQGAAQAAQAAQGAVPAVPAVPAVQAAQAGPSGSALGSAPGAPGAARAPPLHVPYLDAPPNKPTLLKHSGAHEPRARPNVPEQDMYGVKSLLEVLKADSNGIFSPAVGVDIPPFLPGGELVSKSFGSPWPEMAKHCVVPEHSNPSCYVVKSVVPQQQKLQNLTEETLFYIFYTMPRDAMQEAVAVELTNRNWRYHKDLKLWLTKDPLSEPVQQNQHTESGVYVFFDPSSWEKVKKEYMLYYPDIA